MFRYLNYKYIEYLFDQNLISKKNAIESIDRQSITTEENNLYLKLVGNEPIIVGNGCLVKTIIYNNVKCVCYNDYILVPKDQNIFEWKHIKTGKIDIFEFF